MAQKRTVSFRLHPVLADRFNEATSAYYGKVGACFGAAVLMFLQADPKEQAEFIKKVYEAELGDEVQDAVEQAKAEQLKRIKSREDGSKPKRGS
jgi:predicted ATPase with chaperone activity